MHKENNFLEGPKHWCLTDHLGLYILYVFNRHQSRSHFLLCMRKQHRSKEEISLDLDYFLSCNCTYQRAARQFFFHLCKVIINRVSLEQCKLCIEQKNTDNQTLLQKKRISRFLMQYFTFPSRSSVANWPSASASDSIVITDSIKYTITFLNQTLKRLLVHYQLLLINTDSKKR
jgi:hypothetical protein